MTKKKKTILQDLFIRASITGDRTIHSMGNSKPHPQQSKSSRELFEALKCPKVKEISLLTSVGTHVRNFVQNVTHYKKII